MSAIWRSAEGERAVRERTLELLRRWPVAREERRVPTRQGETFVLSCGPEDAPPVILLHGSGSNSVPWMGDAPEWSKALRLHAVDLIGEPGLSAPSRPPLDSDAHALWLDDVLRGLGLERAAFVGVSLGGWLALDYAIRRPERAIRLALLCPGGVGAQRPSFLWKVLPLLFLGGWGRRRALALALGAQLEAATPAEREIGELMALTFRHFKPRFDMLPVFPDESLAQLAMPILAIVGARDALLDSRDTARRLRAATPRAEVELLPDAGHLIRGQSARVLAFLR